MLIEKWCRAVKKCFEKNELLFALIWIGVYVLGLGNADVLSESMGVPKLITALLGLFLSLVLWGFVRKNRLKDYLGLCGLRLSPRQLLYFVPLIIISSVNFWNGLCMNYDVPTTLLFVISMCFVGFLEELIFRGLLFRAICRDGVKSAIIVSSLSFGVGHIVNLLLGAPLFETLLQLVYASAIGFCYTALFCASGSIVPCIISHALVNSTSAFAVEPSNSRQLIIALIQTLLSVSYGLWLLRRGRAFSDLSAEVEHGSI